MIIAIFFVSLIAVSAVSAADNTTSDIVSVDNDNKYEITSSEISNSNENTLSNIQSDSLGMNETADKLTYEEYDYDNVYVESLNGYYGNKNIIKYGWTGSINGYFEIYKGNNIVYKEAIYSDNQLTYERSYEGSAIKSAGTYKAVICDEFEDIIAQASIKINKASTHTISPSFSSKIGSKEYIAAGITDVKEKNLYETSGTAKFKIAGKTYTAKFKKGIAYIKMKMPLKAKTYKCTVKFLGNSNYKASTGKFTIKLNKGNVVILNKNKKVKVGKYTVKLTSKQYNSLVKAFNKDKSKSLKFKTGNKYKVKVPYTKTVKKYKTTKAVKTLYAGSYMPMINHMRANGWKKVSEYTYNQPNPQNKHGIGLSSYTIAVCKWVKVSYKTAYKTKYYPVKAQISYKKSNIIPIINLYANGKLLNSKYLAIA